RTCRAQDKPPIPKAASGKSQCTVRHGFAPERASASTDTISPEPAERRTIREEDRDAYKSSTGPRESLSGTKSREESGKKEDVLPARKGAQRTDPEKADRKGLTEKSAANPPVTHRRACRQRARTEHPLLPQPTSVLQTLPSSCQTVLPF